MGRRSVSAETAHAPAVPSAASVDAPAPAVSITSTPS
jgi:hypothetical protein